MKIISRKQYADKIDKWLGKEQIIVLTGQRRVGKSFLLKDFIQRHQDEENSKIIFIDKEKRDFRFIKDDAQLGDYIEDHIAKGKHNYIIIDEVQDINGWERAIRSFRTDGNTDIILTGSNSKMLSSELSTLLSGRYQEIRVQGLDYSEFLVFHNLKDDEESLWKYLNYGGMPGLKQIGLEDDEQVWEYLKSVNNTVILKDIIERYSIRNISFLNTLLVYLADTMGKVNSATNISHFMKSQGLSISTNIILDYINYFQQTYLINEVRRYGIHGKKLFESNKKIYFGDVGLRNAIVGGYREDDIEKIMESVVYQKLVRLGYQVAVGELRVGEIDFVCTKQNQKKYVQVAYLIVGEETTTREFGRLKEIKDNYPKYVISLSPIGHSRDHEGIVHLNLRDFLKNGF